MNGKFWNAICNGCKIEMYSFQRAETSFTGVRMYVCKYKAL